MDRVSVIVACRNEAGSIASFLESLHWQTSQFEIVIADGISEDGTRRALERFAYGNAQVLLIDNPRRATAAGLNLALRASSGNIIVRMDAHTEYAPDYVATCVDTLQRTGAANVGGPARTRAEGHVQQAVALAFHSRFFSGGARFHDPRYEGPVDTVPYGCWHRGMLEALHGFDENLIRNQDDELNLRIHKMGGVVWQSPSIRSWYAPRRSFGTLAKQYFEYGFWKVAILRKHRGLASWRHATPGIALSSLLALSGASLVRPAFRPVVARALCAYIAVAAAASLACLRKPRNWIYLPALPFVFATVHGSYAAGFLCALARGPRPRRIAIAREQSSPV